MSVRRAAWRTEASGTRPDVPVLRPFAIPLPRSSRSPRKACVPMSPLRRSIFARGPLRSHTKFAALVALTVGLLLGLLVSPDAALAATVPDPTPAYPKDFPDPFVLLVDHTYYAYSTQVAGTSRPWINVPVMSSSDLVSWTTITDSTDAVPTLPVWASVGNTWAPGVLPRPGNPTGQQYVLYSTVTQTSSGLQCVSRATADTPAGPFIDSSSGPLVCQTQRGGSIDPYPFVDANGTVYLLWKSDDNARGRTTRLWAQQLDPSGLSFQRRTSASQILVQTAPWQSPNIEGPAMVLAAGTYYLFYGGAPYDSANSGIGYATCKTPVGPCTDRSTAAPWLASNPNGTPPVGPQGPTIFLEDLTGTTRLGFSGWNGTVGYPQGGVRAFWTARLSFPGGTPTLT